MSELLLRRAAQHILCTCRRAFRANPSSCPRINVLPVLDTRTSAKRFSSIRHFPSQVQDEVNAKAEHVIPFVLELLQRHEKEHTSSTTPPPPLIVGLTAPQGAGKSLLVSLLHQTLTSPPHDCNTVIFSLDDFYLPHEGLSSLAQSNPDNPLLQHRGQPSTHEIPLVRSVFDSLRQNKPTKIPQFNKAAYNGHGDRVPESEWLEVNKDQSNPVRMVLFEGWCVGFRPISDETLKEKYEKASKLTQESSLDYKGRLGHNTLQSVTTINKALSEYDGITSQFDGLIHIDAEDPLYVYAWREEQEHNLIKSKGSGMTDEEVKNFVDGYYPSYELYVDSLREGVFRGLKEDTDRKGRQLRLVVGQDRKIQKVETL